MKKIVLSALLVAMVNILAAQNVFNDANVEVRHVNTFHAIHISNAFEVFLSQGNEEVVAVSASDKDLVSHIKTVVQNGELQIWLEDNQGWKHRFGNRRLRAYISVKDLDHLKGSGASVIKVQGTLSVPDLDVELSGATDLNGALNVANAFKVHLSGASDLKITGVARDANFELNGASNIKAYDFTAGTLTLEASGASDVHITVEKELSARLSGASSLSYKGAATATDVHTSGASSISHKS